MNRTCRHDHDRAARRARSASLFVAAYVGGIGLFAQAMTLLLAR